jgi:hypothetical protein
MFSLSHLFLGLIATAIGVLLLKYNYQLVGYTGRQAWIEDHLGAGTTYFVFQVFAIILAVAGLLYATGLGSSVLGFFLSPFKGIFQGFRSN